MPARRPSHIAQRRGRPTRCSPGPVRAAGRHAARPAVPDGAGLRRAGRCSPSGWVRPTLDPARRRRRPRGVRRAHGRAAGRAPLPRSMAGRVQALAAHRGRRATAATPPRCGASAADGAELLAPAAGLPGFGDQKARIFVALLGKQFGVRPAGLGGGRRRLRRGRAAARWPTSSTPTSLQEVRDHKKAMKAAASARPRSVPTGRARRRPVPAPRGTGRRATMDS